MPGQAPPPPSGTAARPLHSLRRPPQLPHEFRMQFPDVCGPRLYEMPGISTLAGCRVKCLWRNCMRMCVDQDVPWPACIRNLSRETGVAFARAGRASDETAIAFAGEKWAFFVPFSGAEVSSVSTLAIQGCAVVMVVSRWSASAVAEVLLVSTSLRHSSLSAKKFAQRTKNGPQSAVCGVLGEVFRENTAGVVAPGELFRGTAAEQSVPGEFCRATSRALPPPGDRHLRWNRRPTRWNHHKRMGMKKALPKECLVETQNPHRWIAPRGAAARPEGLEPPTF